MGDCLQYTLKCLSGAMGVFMNIPTTTTTIDTLCYLVDCEGNYIVDCECNNIVGCPCITTTTSTTAIPTTTSSTTTIAVSTTTSTTSSSSTTTTTSSTTSSTTTFSPTTTSTTTTTTNLLIVPEGANLRAFGDSITLGPPYVTVPQVYPSVLASNLGISANIFAAGSSGFKTLMKNSNINLPPNVDVAVELTGLNNVYYESNKTNSTSIIGHGVLTFFANQWGSIFVNGANATVNKVGGTFTGYAAATAIICGKHGTVNGQAVPNGTDGVYTSTPGAYVEYTNTFKHAIVGLIGGNGQFNSILGTPIPAGTVRIYLDGNLLTTINLGQQYTTPWTSNADGFGPDVETVGPVMYGITAPTNALHVIRIELVSGDMALDYISILDNPTNCYPAVVGEIPYVDPSQWGVGSQATADSYSSIKEFYVDIYKNQGFPVRYCKINAPTGPYNYVGNTSDGTHPTPAGHIQIASAFEALFV